MATGGKSAFRCADSFLHGRKCVFCGSLKVARTARGYVKCGGAGCGRSKSLARLKREIAILAGFYQLVPAYRLARDLGVDVKVVTRVYQRLRESLYRLTEIEAGRLKREFGLDEACFGGRRGRGARGKSVVFGLVERDGKVYTKVVEPVSAEELMRHIRARNCKGSVYYAYAFRGYRSLRRYGTHRTVSHDRARGNRHTQHPINGIEDFWRYAKHILRNYRGVSRHTFPMYLKEIEYRFNHRKESLFKNFLRVYFGYVRPKLPKKI